LPQRSSGDLAGLAKQRNVTSVLIDADDGSAKTQSNKGTQISDLTLSIAQKLQRALEAQGIEAQLTRASAEPVGPGAKLEKIVNSRAQLLVSIRIGESEFAEQGGYRILYVTDDVDYNASRIAELEQTGLLPIELNYYQFQERNKMISSALLNSLKRVAARDPIAINPCPLFLSKRAPMASAMVVVGYITSANDAQRLLDPARQDELVSAIADGIIQYRSHVGGGTTPVPAPTPVPEGLASSGAPQ
jgi:N-acetylmuramoyl-L-alanine amidase